MSGQVKAKDALYIKLGSSGQWENLCLKDGTLRLDYRTVPHDLALTGDVDAIRDHFVRGGSARNAATTHARQVKRFYDADPDTLWITIANGLLWWAYADGPVEFFGGTDAEVNQRGSRLRKTRDGWHSESVGGVPLRIADLNGALTKVASYRQTICKVDAFDYLVRKLNDKDLPEVSEARSSRNRLIASTIPLMNLLTWQDFELLVELVFAQSGWRRVSTSGGTQKTVDLELVLPSTGEAAFVQVKSSTDQAQFSDYAERFLHRDDSRMFYAWHTSKGDIVSTDPAITLLGPERLAEMVLDAGLFDWLLKKVG